jgi:hypothetical protein
VASFAGVDNLPERMTIDELSYASTTPPEFLEGILQRDLQRAADWCFKVDPDGALAQQAAM